jgi:hypothetical protein
MKTKKIEYLIKLKTKIYFLKQFFKEQFIKNNRKNRKTIDEKTKKELEK